MKRASSYRGHDAPTDIEQREQQTETRRCTHAKQWSRPLTPRACMTAQAPSSAHAA